MNPLTVVVITGAMACVPTPSPYGMGVICTAPPACVQVVKVPVEGSTTGETRDIVMLRGAPCQ
jgi:hypothetical protein